MLQQERRLIDLHLRALLSSLASDGIYLTEAQKEHIAVELRDAVVHKAPVLELPWLRARIEIHTDGGHLKRLQISQNVEPAAVTSRREIQREAFPNGLEGLLRLCLPAASQDEQIGDLLEIFSEKIKPRYGRAYQKLWLCRHTFSLIVAGLRIRTGLLLAGALEAIRRIGH